MGNGNDRRQAFPAAAGKKKNEVEFIREMMHNNLKAEKPYQQGGTRNEVFSGLSASESTPGQGRNPCILQQGTDGRRDPAGGLFSGVLFPVSADQQPLGMDPDDFHSGYGPVPLGREARKRADKPDPVCRYLLRVGLLERPAFRLEQRRAAFPDADGRACVFQRIR